MAARAISRAMQITEEDIESSKTCGEHIMDEIEDTEQESEVVSDDGNRAIDSTAEDSESMRLCTDFSPSSMYETLEKEQVCDDISDDTFYKGDTETDDIVKKNKFGFEEAWYLLETKLNFRRVNGKYTLPQCDTLISVDVACILVYLRLLLSQELIVRVRVYRYICKCVFFVDIVVIAD